MTDADVSRYILVKGIVQGVGFRPFIYSQAKYFNLSGWVRNSSIGVEIEVNGLEGSIDSFLASIKNNPPSLSIIDQIEVKPVLPNCYTDFKIIDSLDESDQFIPISPDMAICDDCKDELFNKLDHRYRYPFINCTNCGPRFSIIKEIPYDRPKTTMANFKMCSVCEAEYEDPLDRRFHAQPIACPDCGPQVWFEANDIKTSQTYDAIIEARRYLKEGKIIAIKGLGGFHLACDASNSTSVEILRKRKGRRFKPFALMSFDLATINKHCEVDRIEKNILESPQHPILLLKKKKSSTISDLVSPGQNDLGFMLPYTPLHLLLIEPDQNINFPEVLVMTSGNISEEPISFDNDDARTKLSDIADGFLMHDRDIYMRVDDSVTRIFHEKEYPIRRSRGYAPNPLRTDFLLPQIFSSGAEYKNTFSLTRDKYIFISHHIGDLDNYPTFVSYEHAVEHFQKLFRIKPEIIASDLHPDYLATKYASQKACEDNLPFYQVQHHHAHLASCLIDNNWMNDKPVLCFCFDGTGLGSDGNIWGGEVLIGDYKDCERIYHLDYIKMPGGDLAAKNPYRMALSYLISTGLEDYSDILPYNSISKQELEIIYKQIDRKINSPLTSSMGRLFDAVSSLIGVRQNNHYEGQAAIELEAICDPDESNYYPIAYSENIITTHSLISSILQDYRNGVSKSKISARFHNSLAKLTVDISSQVKIQRCINTIALSGGVWQNFTLLNKVYTLLKNNDFNVLVHHNIPTNDGGISAGQAIIAAKHFTD